MIKVILKISGKKWIYEEKKKRQSKKYCNNKKFFRFYE